MGVPSFFRWLQRKYPSIITNAVEDRRRDEKGEIIPIDCLEPNLNFQEFDNFYLDMNGIIHPCTHPEHRPAPKTEEEMFELIFEYIDRLFAIVRPRRLLYMAIDGVAPRAKMNQQRSRRFRAAKEAIEKEELIQEIREKLERKGIPLPPMKKSEERFDSNCITPGTPFMDRLAVALRYYVHNKVTLDPAWENIQIILSDANVPGEGEHKIMDYIRRQRSSPTHDPNTAHCLCGADADLIMLGLATHENNFTIIREEFIPNQPRPCDLCQMYGHELKDCKGLASDEKPPPLNNGEANFIFINLAILREYLEREMKGCEYPFEFNLERAIDDWVFMCFFVGNDFLPHLPSLEIREGAIDRLIRLYKENIFAADGWLTDAGEVNIPRVEIMMKCLGQVEDEIFRRRKAREERHKKRKVPRRRGQFVPQSFGLINPFEKPDTAEDDLKCNELTSKLKSLLNLSAESAVDETGKTEILAPWHVIKSADTPSSDTNSEKLDTTITVSDESDSEEAEPYDDVKLHEPGWKERYYIMKFGSGCEKEEFRRQIARDYVEGLCWVLRYYYQGCVSWDWYYPHHYAPFASDFDNISEFTPDFSKPTEPFNPLEQLMAVFPAASRNHIPKAWHSLMTDPDSPLINFYPKDFEIDKNGKKFDWQGVALLPFVDQDLLLGELQKVYNHLTDEEKARNIRGSDRIFISSSHPLFESIYSVFTNSKDNVENEIDDDKWVEINSEYAHGMSGSAAYDKGGITIGEKYPSFVKNNERFPDIYPNKCLMLAYRNPQYDDGHIYPATRLEGIIEIERTLKQYNDNGRFRDKRQARVEESGHRMLKFYTKRNGDEFQQKQYTSYNKNDQYFRNNFRNVGGKKSPPTTTSYSDKVVLKVSYQNNKNDKNKYNNRKNVYHQEDNRGRSNFAKNVFSSYSSGDRRNETNDYKKYPNDKRNYNQKTNVCNPYNNNRGKSNVFYSSQVKRRTPPLNKNEGKVNGIQDIIEKLKVSKSEVQKN